MNNNTKYTNRHPIWKQKLLFIRAKWYLDNYAAARDFSVPLPPVFTDKDSNGLTKCVLSWLKFKGHYSNRINSQGQVRLETVQLANGGSYKKANWTRGTSNQGTADVHAIVNGKSVSIEIKCAATGDKIRPEQLREKERIEAAGGIYYVATDMESFSLWYQQTFENVEQYSDLKTTQ